MAITPLTGHNTRSLTSALLVGALTTAAYLAMAIGVLCGCLALNGSLTGDVPVRITAAAPGYWDATLPCVEGWSLDATGCGPAASPDEWQGGTPLPVHRSGGMVAGTESASPAAALLAAAPYWAGLVATGAVALLLIPALRTTAAGHPFAPGNARRLAIVAAVITGGWAVASAGPMLAAPGIINAMTVPEGWIAPDAQFSWWPPILAGLFAVLAAVVGRGTAIAADTEGLV